MPSMPTSRIGGADSNGKEEYKGEHADLPPNIHLSVTSKGSKLDQVKTLIRQDPSILEVRGGGRVR
jgi:hypothetical protein